VVSNAFSGAVVRELGDGELPTIVGAQHLQRMAAPLLCFCLDLLDVISSGIFGGL